MTDEHDGVRVTTAAGVLRGARVPVGDSTVHAFLNIPYAAPLVGEARFAAPAPVHPWDGERDATAHGPTPPQTPYVAPFDQLLPASVSPGDESLNLSVWTPDPGARGLPVMVWIHGGAFVRGAHSIPTYDGAAFARDGVVMVGINYRLGALGFLSLPGAPDNRGLLDQIAALRWVQDNVAAFGGDPDRVTVFGESAGAMSIASLLASPLAAGLFRRAVVQSGSGAAAAEVADARLVTADFTERFSLPPTVSGVAQLDTDTILKAQTDQTVALMTDPNPQRWGRSIVSRGLGIMALFPTIDGTVQEQLPIDALRGGAGTGVDVLVGTTRDEFRFFLVPTGVAGGVTEELLPAVFARFGMDGDAASVYSGNRPGATPGDVLCAALTDHAFRSGSADIVDAIAARDGQSAWQYEFAWPTPVRDLRSAHALELPFVFDTLDRTAAMTGPEAPQWLADDVHATWVRFATTGDPGWDAVRPDSPRPVRTFGDPDLAPDAVVHDPRADELPLTGVR
ncbi:carboxylesterase/lipase family protein [Williamsia serinedens]|uniref:Carboxylic ester hydrolase n=1 Tax=Williamsia serinedens TaxID=391736 RepID=A0ABT1H396_9NOCA|nr:carboxylesterase family protein [Williamsia serinedens]MCP2161439.1 para-nitrobenzyl esterase [Williamsia serinedens]